MALSVIPNVEQRTLESNKVWSTLNVPHAACGVVALCAYAAALGPRVLGCAKKNLPRSTCVPVHNGAFDVDEELCAARLAPFKVLGDVLHIATFNFLFHATNGFVARTLYGVFVIEGVAVYGALVVPSQLMHHFVTTKVAVRLPSERESVLANWCADSILPLASPSPWAVWWTFHRSRPTMRARIAPFRTARSARRWSDRHLHGESMLQHLQLLGKLVETLVAHRPLAL